MLMVVIITAGAYVLASLGLRRPHPGQHHPVPRHRARRSCSAPTSRCAAWPRTPTRSCCPWRPLLNGLGYVVIAGLPDARVPSGEVLARQQAVWTAIGIAAFVATLCLVKRPRDLERYRYTFALVGLGLLLLPLLPGLGTDRSTAAGSGWRSGR